MERDARAARAERMPQGHGATVDVGPLPVEAELLLHALRRQSGRYGLGSACIGGGQGAAVIVEAFPA